MTSSHFQKTFIAALACMLFLSTRAFATGPAVVVDFQLTWLGTLNQPQSLATAKNGTIYVADSGNGRVLAVSRGTSTVVSTPGFTLAYPDAVAVDAAGDLYIVDEDSATVIEVPVSGSPSLIAGPPTLAFPSALAVDSNGNLYIGDAENGVVYEVPAGGGTLTQIALTGISSVIPAALTTDAANNLYIADDNSNNIYETPAGGGAASNVTPSGFTLNEPSGVVFDSVGNFYVLDSYNERIIEVAASDTADPYQVPINGLVNPSGLTADVGGNLYVADYSNDNVTKVLYNSTPVELGQVSVGTQGTTSTPLSYELNQPTNVGGAQTLTEGDLSNDATAGSATTCEITDYTDNPVGSGNPITAQNPLVCVIAAVPTPAYPGLREMTAQLLDNTGAVIASTPMNEIGLAPVATLSPATGFPFLQGFYAPSQIAVSGGNDFLYVADSGTDEPGTANVYGWNVNSDYQFTVNTGSFTLPYPAGLALNRNGDLYISDIELAEVIVVPANTAIAPYKLNTGTLLQTPTALAFDPQGDLIIGDNGPEGFESSEAQPGFLVEVPHNGGPAFVLNTGSIVLAEPDGLAFTPAGDLYVADAGPYDPDNQTFSPGQVVLIPHDGSTPSVVNVSGFVPAGVSVDPAGDLDVLFAYPASITVVPPNGGSAYSLPFTPDSFEDVNTLTPINGGQNLVFSVDDEGDDSVQGVAGYAGTLPFPATDSGSQSAPLSALLVNAGNLPLTLGNPAFTPGGQSANFPDGGSTTCTNSLGIAEAASCTLSAVFAPNASGDFSATMTLSSNSFLTFGVTPVVSLSGTAGGDPPQVVKAPSTLAQSTRGQGKRHGRPPRTVGAN